MPLLSLTQGKINLTARSQGKTLCFAKSLLYEFVFNKKYNEEGFTTNNEITNDPIFGRRDRKTFNNTISAKYTFSVNASLSLTFRHNWSDVRYQNQFYDLGTDGHLIAGRYPRVKFP